jgi:hypothetical protein
MKTRLCAVLLFCSADHRMNKKDLGKSDICAEYISPAVKRATWDKIVQMRDRMSFVDLESAAAI